MNLHPITERKKTLIVNNIVKACKDIKKLNKTGYNFIYLASGFIAHYNLYGFINYYTREGNLKDDILNNQNWNRFDNFYPGEKDYEYYHQRGEIYNLICEKIK